MINKTPNLPWINQKKPFIMKTIQTKLSPHSVSPTLTYFHEDGFLRGAYRSSTFTSFQGIPSRQSQGPQFVPYVHGKWSSELYRGAPYTISIFGGVSFGILGSRGSERGIRKSNSENIISESAFEFQLTDKISFQITQIQFSRIEQSSTAHVLDDLYHQSRLYRFIAWSVQRISIIIWYCKSNYPPPSQ